MAWTAVDAAGSDAIRARLLDADTVYGGRPDLPVAVRLTTDAASARERA